MKKATLVIHHRDADGYCAAWAAWHVFGDRADYTSIQYKEPLPNISNYMYVYMLDFSLPRDEMIRARQICPNFRCIDHHKSAKDACEGLDFCVFNMEKSGCELAWEFFHPGTEIPMISRYIGDRDIWKFALPYSNKVNMAIMSYDFDFETMDALNKRLSSKSGIEGMIYEGNILERAKSRYVELTSNAATPTILPKEFGEFAGKKCVVVNASYQYISDLLHTLCEKHGVIAIGYFRREDGKWQYSFRSTKEIGTVNNIAKTIGGGGHPFAAGAETEDLIF